MIGLKFGDFAVDLHAEFSCDTGLPMPDHSCESFTAIVALKLLEDGKNWKH